jgi:2-C-methyl-D-erythritol 2,4-cyclodiphosphate synthase
LQRRFSQREGNYRGKGSIVMFRIGQGFDVHQLTEGRPLIIGGITIPYERGLLGHSDADVLLHTVADACLGAIAAGDIGKHFPDTDPEFKDADSGKLLSHVWNLVKEEGYELGNIDCTIIAQMPKMAPYITQMRERIAELLEAEISQVNVKATTSEKLGFTGRGEGIAAQATVLVVKSTK